MPTSSLARLRIKGFRSIREAEINFRAMNVLIGGNGAGKSNLIGVFKLLRAVAWNRLTVSTALSGGAERVLHFGAKTTPRLEVLMEWDSGSYYEAKLTPASEGRLILESEFCGYRNSTVAYGSDGSRFRLAGGAESGLEKEAANHDGGTANYVLRALRSFRVYHFHDVGASAAVLQPGALGDDEELRQDASNLAAFLGRLARTHPASVARIEAVTRQAAPFFGELVHGASPAETETTVLRWRERGSTQTFFGRDLSDGTLRFLCLATLLLQPAKLLPPTVLLDEPELGLHPSAIHLLAAMVAEAGGHTQLVVATQSPTLVDTLEPEDLLLVDRVSERDGRSRSVFFRPDPEEVRAWLEDYSLGDVWQKNVLGATPGTLPAGLRERSEA